MPTFTVPLSGVLLAISQSRRFCASRRGGVGNGAGHRVLETIQKSKDGCRLGRGQRSLIVVPRHLRTSSPLPQGVRPAQGPPFVIISSGLEFPRFEPDLRAVLDVPRTGLGRADSISTVASLRGALAGAGREFVVSRI